MAQPPHIVFRDEEEATERLNRKAKESPFMIIGIGGLVGALGYSAYRYKYRGGMSTSVYLMQTRVVAQGAVVCCLGIGMIYTMLDKYVLNKEVDKK